LEAFLILVFTGKINVVNQSRVPDVSRAPVLIYRQRSRDLFLLVSDELGLSQTERNSGERRNQGKRAKSLLER
jgi:hypothetical protein